MVAQEAEDAADEDALICMLKNKYPDDQQRLRELSADLPDRPDDRDLRLRGHPLPDDPELIDRAWANMFVKEDDRSLKPAKNCAHSLRKTAVFPSAFRKPVFALSTMATGLAGLLCTLWAMALPPDIFTDWFDARGWAIHPHQQAMLDRAGDPCALLIAPTGGGKTMAGFLPTLVELADGTHRACTRSISRL
jgi:hypothetical protein